VQVVEKECKGFTHNLLHHSHEKATTSSLSLKNTLTRLDLTTMASQEAFLSIQPQSYVEFIHGVDEQLTRTPNGVRYSSQHTWTPSGVHLLLN
jgi:hypothetical protein